MVSKSNRQISVVKASNPELAKLFGVDVNESVLVVPITELFPLITAEAQESKEREKKVTAEIVAADPAFSKLTPGEAKIMAALKKLGRAARGSIMSAAGISPEVWNKSIALLKATNLVIQIGERRSAQYMLASVAKEKGHQVVTKSNDADAVADEMDKLLAEAEDAEFDSAPPCKEPIKFDLGKSYVPPTRTQDEDDDVPTGYVEEVVEDDDDRDDQIAEDLDDADPIGLDDESEELDIEEADEEIEEEPKLETPKPSTPVEQLERHMNNELGRTEPNTESKPETVAEPGEQLQW